MQQRSAAGILTIELPGRASSALFKRGALMARYGSFATAGMTHGDALGTPKRPSKRTTTSFINHIVPLLLLLDSHNLLVRIYIPFIKEHRTP